MASEIHESVAMHHSKQQGEDNVKYSEDADDVKRLHQQLPSISMLSFVCFVISVAQPCPDLRVAIIAT